LLTYQRDRTLGDRVLQGLAWKIADQLGWPDTFMAEYIALTQLQADAFVCMDPDLAHAVSGIVTVASIDDLMASALLRRRPQAASACRSERSDLDQKTGIVAAGDKAIHRRIAHAFRNPAENR
jgi:hypothetical protein